MPAARQRHVLFASSLLGVLTVQSYGLGFGGIAPIIETQMHKKWNLIEVGIMKGVAFECWGGLIREVYRTFRAIHTYPSEYFYNHT